MIIHTKGLGLENWTYDSIEGYAENKLDGDDYGKGVIEVASATATNNSKAIGRLLDLLANNGLITASQVGTVVDEYFTEGIVEFVIDT